MSVIRAALVWVDGILRSDAVVVVRNGLIEDVVAPGAVPSDVEVEDWGDVAVLPGTVNAHGHAFQNLLKGFGDDRTFESWRDEVLYPFSEQMTRDDIYTGALFAFTEALLAGVTTTVDFFYLHDEGNKNAEQVILAAKDAGVRLVLARAFYDPQAPTKAPARYREPAHEAAARCKDLAVAHSQDDLISVQPAPHSLHAASPETIAIAMETARELDTACHLHLAEARYERRQIEERYGTTPVRLLEQENLLNERLVAIHSVWIDDEEMDLLADSGAGVVHCPAANAFLGDGIARVPEMIQRGIPVALGPDGGCANNRQGVFDEMRQGALVAKARLTDGSALEASTALAMGTSVGGDLLRLPVGRIRAGNFADLVALDLNDLSLHPMETVQNQIVYSMQPTAIAKVMVGGEIVVEGGRPARVDVSDLRARIASTTSTWTRP